MSDLTGDLIETWCDLPGLMKVLAIPISLHKFIGRL
jgi:hypothetical protein